MVISASSSTITKTMLSKLVWLSTNTVVTSIRSQQCEKSLGILSIKLWCVAKSRRKTIKLLKLLCINTTCYVFQRRKGRLSRKYTLLLTEANKRQRIMEQSWVIHVDGAVWKPLKLGISTLDSGTEKKNWWPQHLSRDSECRRLVVYYFNLVFGCVVTNAQREDVYPSQPTKELCTDSLF